MYVPTEGCYYQKIGKKKKKKHSLTTRYPNALYEKR